MKIPGYVISILLATASVLAEDYEPELPPMTGKGEPAILTVTPNAPAVPQFGKFELTIDLAATYDNPFDPEQVDLTAELTTPAGKHLVVPGFFYQPYRNRSPGDDSRRPLLEPAGEPCWMVRFTPTEIGKYDYVVHLQNRFGKVQGDVRSPPGTFMALPSNSPGFIRVSRTNPRYFEFDNGQPFFAVGQNLQNDWPYYDHSRRLAQGGANCARVWTFCHWTWLEWTFKTGLKWAGPGDWMRSYAGAGRYNQRIAWIADDCLERWTRDGLFVMLCLGNATGGGELSMEKTDSYGSWDGHPYNLANGGFLDDPSLFWTDQHARQLYRQRLRYILARWGYSPQIWALEFWNELGEARPEIVAWHREMAQYVRELDPNRHLLTTSTWQGNLDKFAAIWDLPEMDFTQGHHYGALPGMTARIAEHLARWPKPYLNGEGGGPPARDERGESLDPGSIEFHNSLWAPLAMGSAGTTLPWWWRERIEPQDLFSHYRAVARFAGDVPWNRAPFRPVQIRSITLSGDSPNTQFSPVLIAPIGADWGSLPRASRFRVEADGSVAGSHRLSGELFGNAPGRSQWRKPLVFEVDFPHPGRCLVHVESVSHGTLEVQLDGHVVLEQESPGLFGVDVPAGPHTITLDNTGSDLVRFDWILLTNYRDPRRYPDLDIFGQTNDDLAVLWIHNRLNQWPFQAAGIEAPAVGPAMAEILVAGDARYQVEWWDTRTGLATHTESIESRSGVLSIPIAPVTHDLACKIKSEAVPHPVDLDRRKSRKAIQPPIL